MLIVASVPKLQPITATVAVYLPVLIGTFLSPEWLFLGLERMRAFAVTNVISSAVCIAPIFLFVHSPDDVKIATFITASNTTMAGTICCLLIAKWKLVGRFIRPTRSDITEVCKDAWPLFVTQIAVTMYSASNTVMLGLVRTSYQVGIFSAAEKIKTNACAPINPFVTVAFPKISRLLERDRAKAVNIVGKLLIVLCAVMGAVSLTIFVAAPVIVRLIMGNDFDDAIPVLRILAIMPLAVAITSVFGPVCMINLGLKKELSRIVVMCGIVNIALLLTLGTLYGAVGAAVSITVTETLVATCYGFMLARQGFLRELGAELADKLRWPRAV